MIKKLKRQTRAGIVGGSVQTVVARWKDDLVIKEMWEKMNEIVEHLNRDEEWLLRLLNPSQGYRENAPRVEWE